MTPGYDAKVKHGLIAAPSDQSTSAPWLLTLQQPEQQLRSMLRGKNTNTIVADHVEGNYAAKLRDDLVLEGYVDCYLPSMYELEKLLLNKDEIGGLQ